MNRFLFFFASCFLVVFSNSALALFGDDKAHQRIDELTKQVAQLEARLNEQLSAFEQKSSQGVIGLATQIDLMRDDLAKLRGQVEVLTYELGEIQKRQRDLYTDLDSRLRRFESGARAGQEASIPPSDNAPRGDPASEERAYSDAMELFKRGNYSGAAAAFAAFVATYPQSSQASAAQYWVGNARYAQRDFRGTIEAQTELLQRYPDSPKAPDAMLNLASAQLELGQRDVANTTLQTLINRYPNTEAAAKAKQRLR
ncbi:MAG: tol-pal system protein YbgF [Burkholderiales bacterium]|jgi:tol-pal system protein YbgF|nr:tol-pal system protein YbgF [Burkholderiales bacterium]